MSAHRSTSRWWGRCEAEKTRYSSLKPISGVYFLGFDVDQVLGMMLYPYAHTPYPHVVIGWCQVQKGAELPLSVTQVAKTFLKATVEFIRLS